MDTRGEEPGERKSPAERIAMSSKRLFTLVLGTLIVSCASTLLAQVNIPSARFDPRPADSHINALSIPEPGTFGYDAQVFAPLEFSNQEELEPNTGFYLTYDRLYTSISKPDGRAVGGNGVSTGGNYSWGNRYELGWITKNGDGWGAVYELTEGSFFTNGQDRLVSNPMLVTTSFANVEFNRVFRQSTAGGGQFEPYLGFRFNSVSDNTIQDTDQGMQMFDRFRQNATNDLFGAHAAGRYTKRHGRFRSTLDGAVGASYNRQRYFATNLAVGGPISPLVTEFNDDDTSFVPLFDLRAEISYNVSRDLGIRTGFQVIYMFDGVGRADTLASVANPNSSLGPAGGVQGVFDENFSAASFTFGLEWKR